METFFTERYTPNNLKYPNISSIAQLFGKIICCPSARPPGSIESG
jgi:hypothetical protein